jgi:hypothetical protein
MLLAKRRKLIKWLKDHQDVIVNLIDNAWEEDLITRTYGEIYIADDRRISTKRNYLKEYFHPDNKTLNPQHIEDYFGGIFEVDDEKQPTMFLYKYKYRVPLTKVLPGMLPMEKAINKNHSPKITLTLEVPGEFVADKLLTSQQQFIIQGRITQELVQIYGFAVPLSFEYAGDANKPTS